MGDSLSDLHNLLTSPTQVFILKFVMIGTRTLADKLKLDETSI